MSLFSSRRKREAIRIAREAARHPVKAPILCDGGVSPAGAHIYKANIGHRTVKHLALLFAIVVADGPEEAGELLARWSDAGDAVKAFIRSGEFILEEIDPHRKGVL